MANNEFKPFATAAGANVTSQSEWENLPALFSGFTSGKASSAQINKAVRQASVIASVVAQFIADTNDSDVLDNGNIVALQQSLLLALQKNAASNIPVASTTTAGIVQLSSATSSDSELLAATSKAVKTANDNANGRVPSGRTVNGKALSVDIALSAGDVGALDAATADSRYLPALSPSILHATELDGACFLIARKLDDTDDWYVGRGSDSSDNITLRSYILDTELMLRSASIAINKPLLIEGALAYTSNNPPPLTRVWVSGEYTPVINTPTILNHGLVDIDPLRCSVDVLLKCVNANNGYNVGDFAVGWGMHPSANAALSPMPVLSATQIQLNTGGYHTGIYLMPKSSGSSAEAVLSDWRYVFRIFY
ncbi:tail fiber protein [Pectobacterium brasiliense]|uniref:tail fiber protein n=1 Tax=Pectobacterium brasiliense TaxID=180957 RepID=UPI001969F5B1|nr:tail fiber protein [Pectobacterium brasiliense]MBN3093470.1 tail fiber protein [Pectobacterium brasiliense]